MRTTALFWAYPLVLVGCLSETPGPTREDEPANPLENERGSHGRLESALRKGTPGSANGQSDYCSTAALCASGEGDCDSSTECQPGNVCAADIGLRFGFPDIWDFCVPPSCLDGIQNNGETGLDCGTEACGLTCACPGSNGAPNFCTPSCPCGLGEGDCDANSSCEPGLVCGVNNGPNYGMPATFETCVPLQCKNRRADANETGVDCGGACGGTCPTLAPTPPEGFVQTAGPDAFGYRGGTAPFFYEALTGQPDAIDLGALSDDEVAPSTALPFGFDFYGSARRAFFLSSNGFISFLGGQGDGCCVGQVLPSAAAPNALIAGYWEDLNDPPGPHLFAVRGVAPNRRAIIEYAANTSFRGGAVNFQIILYENGNIALNHSNSSANLDGFPTTVGIENDLGTVGLQLLRADAANLTNASFFFVHP